METDTSADPRIVPSPPRLHWGFVLALQILTLGMFGLVWLIVQALWVKHMTHSSKGLTWAIINLSAFPVGVLVIALLGSSGGARLLFLALNLTTVFTLRSQMEDFPIGMSLSGGLTFLLGTIYLQYHMNDYVLPEASDIYGTLPPSPAYVPATLPGEPR